jgi:hypothetical protein
MSRGLTPTFNPWPPPGHARHRNESSRPLAGRLASHSPSHDARLTQVQSERGGSRILTQTGLWRTS